MTITSYQQFLDRLHAQDQFDIVYDPRAMLKAVELDGLSRQPARCNILVGGTNGKGSIASFLHALCVGAGWTTALYTSPHLVSFRERIRINGTPIATEEVVKFGADLFERYGDPDCSEDVRPLTYFELVTLLSLRYVHAAEPLDVAIFEVGLGGRLDATNVVEADIACFGSVSLEHQEFLGDTLSEIAREKAAIATEGCTAIVHRDNGGASTLIRELREVGAVVHSSKRLTADELGVSDTLEGEARHRNREIAWSAFSHIADEYGLVEDAQYQTLEFAKNNVIWPGRQARVKTEKSTYWLDGAHNNEALIATCRWLESHSLSDKNSALIFGVSGARSMVELLQPILPFCHDIVLTNHIGSVLGDDTKRRAIMEQLSAIGRTHNIEYAKTVNEAISMLRDFDHCIICGSLYLVGDAYRALGYSESSPPPVLRQTTF